MTDDPGIDFGDVGTRPNLRYDMCIRALAAAKHGVRSRAAAS
jgi:predicted dehydrogenase